MTQPQTPSQARGGRRSATRRRGLNLTTVLAVALPVLSAGALLLVQQDAPGDQARPPARSTLTAATLTCPAALPGTTAVSLTTVAEGVDATVTAGSGDAGQDVPLRSGRVSTFDADKAVPISGEDEAAPGLLAARVSTDEHAAVTCPAPEPVQWFTGVGAGPAHASVLELTNPDAGTAVADITVLGRDGQVDVPRLRGVSVPGGTSVRLDLAAIVPRTDELAVEVLSTRGRIGATVDDRLDKIGSVPLTEDWLPGQAAPARQNVLLGLPPDSGSRVLVVANPGDDEARVQLKVVGPQSVFAPEGVGELRVPPHSTVQRNVSDIVKAGKGDALGFVVDASAPVTAAVRSYVHQDLSHATAGTPFSDPATVLVAAEPDRGNRAAERQVVLAAASSAGTVTVVTRDGDGKQLSSKELEITPGRALRVSVPAGAEQVSVAPSRTAVTGVVVTSAQAGATVQPLTVPVTSGLVPDVRPGLP